jgi:hypothetical protein
MVTTFLAPNLPLLTNKSGGCSSPSGAKSTYKGKGLTAVYCTFYPSSMVLPHKHFSFFLFMVYCRKNQIYRKRGSREKGQRYLTFRNNVIQSLFQISEITVVGFLLYHSGSPILLQNYCEVTMECTEMLTIHASIES